jgi:hypothetical protein
LARWKEEDWEAKKTRMFANEAPANAFGGAVVQTNPISAVAAVETAQHSSVPSFQDSIAVPAGGQMCKTNPIGEGGGSRQGGYTPIFRPRG